MCLHYGIRGAQRKRLAINKKGPDEPIGVHPALRFSARFHKPGWEREERPGLGTCDKVPQAALVSFSVAMLTRFEIGAKASL